MSNKKKAAEGWPRKFGPNEAGFPEVLVSRDQHVAYLKENKLRNYLNKIDYPEGRGLTKAESLANDLGIKRTDSLWYKINADIVEFVDTVRGFSYYRSRGKNVHKAVALTKGMELK